MTRADWLTCTEPARLLDFVRGRATDRQLRLFACAWGRSVWRYLADERSRDAVLIAERFADGEATVADLLSAYRGATDAVQQIPLAFGRHKNGTRHRSGKNIAGKEAAEVARCASDPEWDARVAARATMWKNAATSYALSNHLRDIFNPFRTSTVPRRWLTSTVLTLARTACDTADFSVLPILADALQDAGCDDEEVLAHCRGETAHVRGCWAVDWVLGEVAGGSEEGERGI